MTRALLICPVTHLLLLLQTIITLHASATNIKQRRWRRLGNLTIITLHASATRLMRILPLSFFLRMMIRGGNQNNKA